MMMLLGMDVLVWNIESSMCRLRAVFAPNSLLGSVVYAFTGDATFARVQCAGARGTILHVTFKSPAGASCTPRVGLEQCGINWAPYGPETLLITNDTCVSELEFWGG